MIVLATASLALFFRYNIATEFNLTFTGSLDGTSEVSILERWFNVLRGREHWSQPLFLYPAPTVPGYNDGYLLFGVVYAGPRWLGCDPVLAEQPSYLIRAKDWMERRHVSAGLRGLDLLSGHWTIAPFGRGSRRRSNAQGGPIAETLSARRLRMAQA